MKPSDGYSNTELNHALDRAHGDVTLTQRHLLELVAQCDDRELWRSDGARDGAEWLGARLGISTWAARRWINAAHALRDLPLIAASLASGELGLDKVLELCRVATPATEKKLIPWARRVSAAAIRRRADLAARIELDAVTDADESRYLRHWYFDDGRRLGLEAALPADQGAVVVAALDRIAKRLPDIVADDEDDEPERDRPEDCLEARRADALVALASARIADDHDPDRATVVVHAEVAALSSGDANAELERGPVIHPETALRLACDCRLQSVLHDPDEVVVGIGRTSRVVPQWLLRQLRRRDRGCLFPGCGRRSFLHAHHIKHWIRGGLTDLDNLGLVCTFHHKLVHEYGWWMVLDEPGTARWFRASSVRYDPAARPGNPLDRAPPKQLMVA